jgi:hypothetical protein
MEAEPGEEPEMLGNSHHYHHPEMDLGNLKKYYRILQITSILFVTYQR